MSLSDIENEKYYKKYLKYKQKYIQLEEEIGGGSKLNLLKSFAKKGASVAKSVASNPAVQAVATSAAMTAAQQPEVQAKLAEIQQTYNTNPAAQLAAQMAMSNPKVQSVMAKPIVQQVKQSVQTGNVSSQALDNVWRTLSIEQKQKLIDLLPTLN